MLNDLDLLLVHPNASKRIYQGLSKDFSAIEPPIWAAMISTYLKLKGLNVAILDCEADERDDAQAAARIRSYNPQAVCFVVYGQQPSASTQNMVGAMSLMNMIKDMQCPRIYVGGHSSALPERTINEDLNVFVCKGEGCKTLEDFLALKDFNDVTDLKTIRGLCFYDHKENKVQINPPSDLIQNLDEEIPEMDWGALQLEKYRTANWHSWTNGNDTGSFAALYTSLGCPYACSFCCINAPFNEGGTRPNVFRNWSPQRIVKTFDHLADMGIKNIKIADELFVLKRSHFMEVCKLIKERGHKFNIWC